MSVGAADFKYQRDEFRGLFQLLEPAANVP